MHFFNFYHGHRASLHVNNFWRYEFSIWLHTLALSLIWVFIPILMLKSGFTLREVIAYYLLYNLIDVPLNFVARALVRRWGARFVIAAATLLIIGFFILFLQLSHANVAILILLALCGAMYDTLYWVAHIYLFIVSDGAQRHTAGNTGILYAVREFAGMLGPALGAAVLLFFNQTALLGATLLLLCLSLIPLLRLRNFPDKPEASPLPAQKFFASGDARPFLLTAFYAVHDSVEHTLFPLFIFLTFGTLQSVVFIPIIFSLVAMVLALTLGQLQARRRGLAISLGALLVALLWALRLHWSGGVFLYLSVFLVGLFSYFILVPLDSRIFEHARRVGDPLSAATYRNLAYMGMNVLLYGSLLLLLNIFSVSFALAAASLIALAAINTAYIISEKW